MNENIAIAPQETESPKLKELLKIKLLLQLKKMEVRLSHPQQAQEFFHAAETYSQHLSDREWEIPENISPVLYRDLHLIKDLEPLNLSNTKLYPSPEASQFQALTSLDYCYSPAKMSKRTGIPKIYVESLSQSSRQIVANKVTELLQTAYPDTQPLDNKTVNPDSFSRPYIILVTPEDMRILRPQLSSTACANRESQLAILSFRQKSQLFDKQLYQKKLSYSIHEIFHLVRLYRSPCLHYTHIPDERLNSNIEEGCTSLLTSESINPSYESTPYTLAGDRFKNGFIPKIVDRLCVSQELITDSTLKSTDPDYLTKVITARFLLGDYEILGQLDPQFSRDQTEGTNIGHNMKHQFDKKNNSPRSWHNVSEILIHPDIFGGEVNLSNQFYSPATPEERADPDRWRNPELGQSIDLQLGDTIPIPSIYAGNTNVPFNEYYTYEVYSPATENWEPIKPKDLKLVTHRYIRVNYVLAIPDLYSSRKKST